MPRQTRHKTQYPGVYYIMGTSTTGKPEKIFYIFYRKERKQIEEKAGRQFKDDMTAAKANQIRSDRISSKSFSNQERREQLIEQEQAERNKWTINKLWEFYKESKPNNKDLANDDSRFKRHLTNFVGHLEPKEITSLDIQRIKSPLIKAKKASATIKHPLELIRRIVNFGVKQNLCEGMKIHIEMPKLNNEKTEDLTPEQLERLITAIDKFPDIQAANFMRMALFTGARRGELFRLQWEDIDFERGFVYLRDPKGVIDQKVPLNGEARKVLENHPRHSTSPYVFPGRGGKQRIDIKKQVNKIKNAAGLPKGFRAVHGLRHVYASTLASSGRVDMYTLQKLLTHKSPQMTQRYAHLRDEALKQGADVAGEIFGSIGKTEENHGLQAISTQLRKARKP